MNTDVMTRMFDEEIINIVRSVLDNGTGKAETYNERLLIKLMQLRGTPITSFTFDQEQVDSTFTNWLETKKLEHILLCQRCSNFLTAQHYAGGFYEAHPCPTCANTSSEVVDDKVGVGYNLKGS